MLKFENRVLNHGPVYTSQMEKIEVSPKKTSPVCTKGKTEVVANSSIEISLACQSQKSPKQIVAHFPSESEISEEFQFFVEEVLKNNPRYTRSMAEDFVKSHY